MTTKRKPFIFVLILSIAMADGVMSYPRRKFPLYMVDVCPENQREFEKASMRLNCTMQPNVFENRYHCMATRDRTRLVEFCYPETRSIFGKGQCVIFDASFSLDNYNCLHFTDGCPETYYYTDQLYKYPKCFQIDPNLKCFVSDLQCITRNRITTHVYEDLTKPSSDVSHNPTTDSHNMSNLVLILVSSFIILGILAGLSLYLKIKMCVRRTGDQEKNMSETMNLLPAKSTPPDDIYDTTVEKENEKNIDREIQNMIVKTQNMLLSYNEEMGNLFVKTRALSRAMDLLERKRYVFIKGNPGDGKTTLSKHILLELQKEKMRPLQIFSVKSLYESIPTCSNLAIFLDNLFGEITLANDELHVYEMQQHVIKEIVFDDNRGDGNMLIVTIRNDIYSECMNVMKESEFFENSLVDLSSGNYSLNLEELKTFVTKYDLEKTLSGNKLQEVLNLGKSIGIPQCLKLMKGSTDFGKNVHSIFEYPYEHLNKEIRKRIKKKEPKIAILIYILLRGGSVEIEVLKDPTQDKELKLKAMEIAKIKDAAIWDFQDRTDLYHGSFTAFDKFDRTCRFTHSSIQESVFLFLCQDCASTVIEWCSPALLVNLAIQTPTKPFNEFSTNPIITRDMFPSIYKRFVSIIRRKDVQEFKAISMFKLWKNENFYEGVIERSDCMDHFINGLDDYGQSMLVHFSEFGNLKLVALLHPFSSEEQKYISLNKASAKNHLDVVNCILEKDVIFDLKTCFFAVQSGNINMVSRFASRVDLTQKTFSNHPRWANIQGGLLHEVIFFGQNHLIQPLLKDFPELSSVVNSTGGSALHFVAFAGEKEIFSLLVQKGFDPYCRTFHGTTVLHYACQNGKLDMVNYLYEGYPELFTPNYNDFEGQSCLHWAAQSGNLELYEYLLKKNVKYSHDLNTPLHMACTAGQYDMFDYLLKKHPEALQIKNIEGKTVLHCAANGGNVKIFKSLLEKNVQIDELTNKDETVLHVASESRQFELVQYLVNEYSPLLDKKDEAGKTALHCAAWGGNIDVFKFLIEKGLNVKCKTVDKRTVLHMCCKNGKIEIAKYLMYNDNDLFSVKDKDGVTALHEMARSGDFLGFQYLFQYCKDPYIKTTSDRSLLHFACQGQDKGTVKFLCEKYPDLQFLRNKNEYTVLHDSVISGNKEIFRYLISRGLVVGDVTKDGETVLHLAAQYGHIDLCKFIVEHYQNLIDVKDCNGDTALHSACAKNEKLICEFLVDKFPQLLEVENNEGEKVKEVPHDDQRGFEFH